MHLLLLCEYGTINGGEQSLLAALDHCPDDVRVTVLAPAEGRFTVALSERGITHVPFSVRDGAGQRLPSGQVLDALADVVARLAPDLVHANSLSMGRITGQLAERLSVPCTAHLRDIIGLSRTAVNHLNGNARLMAVSAATRDFHIAQGVDPERVAVLYNGIDCEHWQPQPRTGRLNDELRISKDATIAAVVGQIGLRKGLDVLVRAAIELADELPRLYFAIIGERTSAKAESVACERSLHEAIAAAGIAERFRWLGYRGDVKQLLSEADLLIHPARQEPFGRVLLEAAASGLPIIATRVGGTEEMLTPEESALLIEPDDAFALAAAARRVIPDHDLRARLGRAARDRIASHFDIRERSRKLFATWRSAAR